VRETLICLKLCQLASCSFSCMYNTAIVTYRFFMVLANLALESDSVYSILVNMGMGCPSKPESTSSSFLFSFFAFSYHGMEVNCPVFVCLCKACVEFFNIPAMLHFLVFSFFSFFFLAYLLQGDAWLKHAGYEAQDLFISCLLRLRGTYFQV